MNEKTGMNIAIIEPSDIIYEGVSNILHRSGKRYIVYRVCNLDELQVLLVKVNIGIAIINPSCIQNRNREFHRLKKNNKGIFWIAVICSLYDNMLLKEFDEHISVTDQANIIIKKAGRPEKSGSGKTHDNLTDRETDVLIHLVKGLSNKEIAEVLNISIHTVISHRKNITEKTGIRSLPGLTVFAISNNIVPIDRL